MSRAIYFYRSTYLRNLRRSARILVNPSCHRAFETWNAGDERLSLSTEKARKDLVDRRGNAYDELAGIAESQFHKTDLEALLELTLNC